MSHQVTLSWVPPSQGDAPSSYDVRRAPAPNGVIGAFVSIATPTSAAYVDTTVVSGEYAYEVSSVNAAGESAPCASVLVTVPVAVPNPPSGLVCSAS